jgi:aspartate aminotransferase-like enzyme
MASNKLFIPGPVQVSEKTFAAFTRPMIGHRGKGFQELYASIQPGLQKLFYTQQPVFVATGSAWCVMEAALRNLVSKKVLCCMNGAFSDKWLSVAKACGKQAEALQVAWGQPILPEQIEAKLKTGEYDAITVIHNETSTGTMSPLAEIARVVQQYPDVQFIVDVVSSFSVTKIPFDDLKIDVMLAGVQKALALPPGAAVFAVSEKAYKKAETIKDRGYYMDFLEFRKNHEKNMTPTTPSISHFYALQSKIAEIEAEGLEARYQRHYAMAQMVRQWVKERGFRTFPEEKYTSLSVTCVENTPNIDVAKLVAWLKENKKVVMDGGYGDIKGKTFRIPHMGDETPETIREFLGWLDQGLEAIGYTAQNYA